MRDVNRLNYFYDELQKIHITYFPDWRFTQLISNIQTWLKNEKKISDTFFIEEIPMISFISEYAEKYGTK